MANTASLQPSPATHAKNELPLQLHEEGITIFPSLQKSVGAKSGFQTPFRFTETKMNKQKCLTCKYLFKEARASVSSKSERQSDQNFKKVSWFFLSFFLHPGWYSPSCTHRAIDLRIISFPVSLHLLGKKNNNSYCQKTTRMNVWVQNSTLLT